jgi:ribonuclease J
VLAVIALNKRTGQVEQQPEVIMRGFGGQDITNGARDVVMRSLDGLSLEEKADYGVVKEKIRVELKRFIQKTTGRRPMVMPVVMEI